MTGLKFIKVNYRHRTDFYFTVRFVVFPQGKMEKCIYLNHWKYIQNTDMVKLILMWSCSETLNCFCCYVLMELGGKLILLIVITSDNFVLMFSCGWRNADLKLAFSFNCWHCLITFFFPNNELLFLPEIFVTSS